MQVIKVKTEGRYTSHNVKANKSIDVTFKMPYTELTNYIQSLQMLNEDVTLAGKIGADKKPLKLGIFMVQKVTVDNDGEGTIKFNSQLDYVEPKNINELASRNDEPLFIFMKATIDIDESELEEEEDSEEDE